MANVKVIAPADQAPTMAPPTRTDDQILPHIRWCQLDEQWFNLTKDTLRDALQITPVDNNNAFSSHPTLDALINFVNDLGYPKVVRNLSNVVTNDTFQPWRALTTIINLCLTGKTSGFERPRALVLQILWGHTHGKKKATLIVILNVRFTKLIIYHLQRKHKFYPRPDSPLHLPNEEPVLGYLKFSAKGNKREVFGIPIPNELITADIQGSDLDSPSPKPAKATKKSKPSAPRADPRPPVTKPASSQQPKHKLASSKVVEESLKSVHDPPRGSLPLVVIREPDPRKYQSLLEVLGKDKEKVSDEQVACDLLTLQTPKNVNPAEQYIFQRRTHALTEPSGHAESSSIYAALGLTDSASESDEDVPLVVEVEAQDEGQAGSDPGVFTEGQARLNLGVLTEGQAGLDPGVLIEGQAGSDPSDDAKPQP
nr:hypothetical protein [Tanacetum cinerariifolium]